MERSQDGETFHLNLCGNLGIAECFGVQISRSLYGQSSNTIESSREKGDHYGNSMTAIPNPTCAMRTLGFSKRHSDSSASTLTMRRLLLSGRLPHLASVQWSRTLVNGKTMNKHWHNWSRLSKPTGWSHLHHIAVGRNPDGRREVFAVSSDGRLASLTQNAPSSDWGQWHSLGSPPDTEEGFHSLDVGQNQDGRLEALAFNVNRGELWFQGSACSPVKVIRELGSERYETMWRNL
jgi:hypothetical protein